MRLLVADVVLTGKLNVPPPTWWMAILALVGVLSVAGHFLGSRRRWDRGRPAAASDNPYEGVDWQPVRSGSVSVGGAFTGYLATAPFGKVRISPEKIIVTSWMAEPIIVRRTESVQVVLGNSGPLTFRGDGWLEHVKFRPLDRQSVLQDLHVTGWVTPPSGWFPDNQHPELHRYWTGTTWTDQTRQAEEAS